jgi:hypothetical protein
MNSDLRGLQGMLSLEHLDLQSNRLTRVGAGGARLVVRCSPPPTAAPPPPPPH